jgi:CDP-glucose 4,6-dehydratase
MYNLFNNIYQNKTVLVTGHTGFKGSWLCLWLSKMGAKVVGYSLEAPTIPNHIDLLDLNVISIIGDITDEVQLNSTFELYRPDIVFHLAAQPLVRYSYDDPILTYETNVIGTLKVFEASKKVKVKAIVNITTDKCYENKEINQGYNEDDRLGGYDPYSSSKACSEILTSSYKNSYFNLNDYEKTHNTLLASCRAGNVIGGGDWAKDRLIPDIIRAINKNERLEIRSPYSTRPWQHVLEPLHGYLMIGQKLLEGKKEFASAWNFGPDEEGNITVEKVVQNIKNIWNKFDFEIKSQSIKHEANLLNLDCTKAKIKLDWKPIWNSQKTFEQTINWYKEYYENNGIISSIQLEEYIKEI